MVCQKSPNKELGVTNKYLPIWLILVSLTSTAQAEFNPNTQATCTSGSFTQLYQFFSTQDYITFARAKTKHKSEVLFLITSDMSYFHMVDLTQIRSDYFRACITTSAREIDYQYKPPRAGLLERINRAHHLFQTDIPSQTKCPSDNGICRTWTSPPENVQHDIILTGYEYSPSSDVDTYDEPVELKIDNQYVHASRGMLAQLARTKYALRMTNALGESAQDIELAKQVYRNIYLNIDHQLALIEFSYDHNHNWLIQKIERQSGLVWTLSEGTNLHMYPLSKSDYANFTQANQ